MESLACEVLYVTEVLVLKLNITFGAADEYDKGFGSNTLPNCSVFPEFFDYPVEIIHPKLVVGFARTKAPSSSAPPSQNVDSPLFLSVSAVKLGPFNSRLFFQEVTA